jgi:O-antigen/teichoic acid export membrane protein
MFLPNVLGFATLPALSARARETDNAELLATMRIAVRTSLAVIVPLAIVVALLSPWIMRVYGESYRSAWPSLALLAVASIPATAIAVYTNALTVLGRWRSMLAAQAAWIALYLGIAVTGLALGLGAAALGAAMLAGNLARLLLSVRAMRMQHPISAGKR